MASLVKRERTIDDLFDFKRDFDRMITRFFPSASSPEWQSQTLVEVPPVEAWIDQEKKKYHLGVAMPPGMVPKEIELSLQGNSLTVSGERKRESEKKKGKYLHQEFSYGRFERTIELPEGVDASGLTAEYNNGILEITAPLSASALPKQIEIKSSASAKGAGA
jgi:HSP20 family protein